MDKDEAENHAVDVSTRYTGVSSRTNVLLTTSILLRDVARVSLLRGSGCDWDSFRVVNFFYQN